VALADVIDLLRCPHCGAGLALAERSLRCPAGHSFDVARQGYVNLLPGDAAAGSADTTAMVEARAEFLGAGHYSALADLVAAAAEAAAARSPGCLVDIGAGTGYWLATALERLPGRPGLALDISKHALRRAARAHPRIGAVACDAWSSLPVADGVAAVVLSVFAPRGGAEIARLLAPAGRLVVVSPSERHLAELVEPLGLLSVDERKRERLWDQLSPLLVLESEHSHEESMSLTRAAALAAARMGPSAHHVESLEEAIRSLPEPVPVTAAVRISVWARAG
jgi:23S rRNA (guanine745-N1)-methyltransferase